MPLLLLVLRNWRCYFVKVGKENNYIHGVIKWSLWYLKSQTQRVVVKGSLKIFVAYCFESFLHFNCPVLHQRSKFNIQSNSTLTAPCILINLIMCMCEPHRHFPAIHQLTRVSTAITVIIIN